MTHPLAPQHSTLQKVIIVVGFILLGFVIWEVYGMWNNGVRP